MPHKKLRVGSIVKFLIIVTALVLAGLIFLNRQRIIDQINYWNYTPSSEIASFAARSSMNDEGKFLFYSAHPSLEDRDAFNASCPTYSSDTAILGCYDGQNIYIYNVTNTDLDGIREETSAYEMLHAAYKRLSDSDRKNLDTLIEAEYAKQATSDTDKAVAYFAKFEPGERDDELFSVIATHFATISPALETYYARYFINRQDLVALFNKYQGVFDSLKQQSTDLYNTLSSLSAEINAESKQYNDDSATLSNDIDTFNTKAKNGGFSSQSDFDSQRAALIARSNALEKERTDLNSKIDTYNKDRAAYEALVVRQQALNSSIDSTVAPAPSL